MFIYILLSRRIEMLVINKIVPKVPHEDIFKPEGIDFFWGGVKKLAYNLVWLLVDYCAC